jgi:hypothetical protein
MAPIFSAPGAGNPKASLRLIWDFCTWHTDLLPQREGTSGGMDGTESPRQTPDESEHAYNLGGAATIARGVSDGFAK